MSVQFILGRSGTGKTSLCVNEIVEALLDGPPKADQRLLFLVPEQASYQAERAILADSRKGCLRHRGGRIRGYHRLEVVSFARLHFLLLGQLAARPELSQIGRQMLIHRLLRENSDKLQIFGNSAHWPGLGRQMAQTIRELHCYGKTQEDLDQFLAELQKADGIETGSGSLSQTTRQGPTQNLASADGPVKRGIALKFQDIALIFKEYLKAIEGRFLDPDVELNQLTQVLRDAPLGTGRKFIKGARLWVDGFSHFTGGQLEILSELLKQVEQAKIALCLDPGKIDVNNPAINVPQRVSLFNPTEKIYAQLFGMVKKCKLKLEQPVILKKAVRFSNSRPLAHVEKNFSSKRSSRISSEGKLRIVSAPDARSEVEFVARQIIYLVKGGEFRYRDIAVITPEVERYEHYARAVFEDYRIPFFIDKRKSLQEHPVVEVLCSALSLVGDDFSRSDIFSYLKTDLAGLDRYEVDLLENYCIAFGLRPEEWLSKRQWNFAAPKGVPDGSEQYRQASLRGDQDFDEGRINEIRSKVMEPILLLRQQLRDTNGLKAVGPDVFIRIVFDFLKRLCVPDKLSEWVEQANEQGEYSMADEHRQFYEKMVGIFDELVEVFGGQQMSSKDFLSILRSGFSQLTLAFIPPSLDQVLVGSIERSRHPDLKAAFLVGANQSQFPVPLAGGGVLTDEDREAAEGENFSLASKTEQRLMERQYLAYIAFTRPSDELFVSYPLADKKGSPEVRSQYVERLEGLFQDLQQEYTEAQPKQADKINSEAELAEFLSVELGRSSDGQAKEAQRQELYNLLDGVCEDEELARIGEKVNYAINYRNAPQLDKQVVDSLFGGDLESSATKIGTFAACPFKYFARYILKLEKRREFKLEPLDLGLFYHRVLDLLLKKLKEQKVNFTEVSEHELLGTLRGQIRELVEKDAFISNFTRHSAHNAFIINSATENLEFCALAIKQMVCAGSFKPTWSELGFGSVGGEKEYLGKYKVKLCDGRFVSLSGKVDRLDTTSINSEKVGIVFDYKRTESPFDWSHFYHGLNMQLPIYMLAALKGSNERYRIDKAGGGFFMPVEARPGKTELGEMEKKAEKFQYKARGILNGRYAMELDNSAYLNSVFYNFYVKKDGSPYGRYNDMGILEPERFEKLLSFTQDRIKEILEDTVSGRIEVSPYRLGMDSPCERCDYRSVCRFDWQINDYNPLEKLTKREVVERISKADG